LNTDQIANQIEDILVTIATHLTISSVFATAGATLSIVTVIFCFISVHETKNKQK
jgi:hypothetical protein